MPEDTEVKLISREDGQAVVRITYNGRHAELRLDRIEAARNGPPFEELVRQEIHSIMDALDEWMADPEHSLE
jgi:hypothetical protein